MANVRIEDIVETVQKIVNANNYIDEIVKMKVERYRLLEKECKFAEARNQYGSDFKVKIEIEGYVSLGDIEIHAEGIKYTIREKPTIVILEKDLLSFYKGADEQRDYLFSVELRAPTVRKILLLATMQREFRLLDRLEEELKKYREDVARELSFIKQVISLIEMALGGKKDG